MDDYEQIIREREGNEVATDVRNEFQGLDLLIAWSEGVSGLCVMKEACCSFEDGRGVEFWKPEIFCSR